jgi:hypothetical protein
LRLAGLVDRRSPGRRAGAVWLGAGVLPILAGCATAPRTVLDVFPPAAVANPWVLRDTVWVGAFAEAESALGDDASLWGTFAPARVWLAVYCHQDATRRCLTVRCFAFASAEDAQQAYRAFAPPSAPPLSAGDEGCWSEVGVLIRTGRIVWDVFGDEASWGRQVQSMYLANVILKRLPPGLEDDPR